MNRKITPFQKFVALALTVALVAMMVAPAFAYDEAYSHAMASGNSDWNIGNNGGIATDDLAGNDEYLAFFVVQLKHAVGVQSGIMTAKAYEHNASGSYLLETSEILDLSTTSINYDNYTFSFNNVTQFEAGKVYIVGIVEGITGVASQAIVDTGGSDCHTTGDQGVTWASSGTQQLCYSVYMRIDPGSEDEPAYNPDTGTLDYTDYDTLIGAFMGFIVPLIVVLLPALLLMFLTRRTDKWLLIIGITIGAGLGYYFGMVPLWLVFLVTIGLIGMAYQSVRGGGTN